MQKQYSLFSSGNFRKIFIPVLLFLMTFLTTTVAGTMWASKNYLDVLNWHEGLLYSCLILTFLSAHEFGHYFAAKYHKINCTLPYFIPFFFPLIPHFGTFGAVIKTRTPFTNKKVLFDIGIAGPLAGFVVCLIFLIYGFINLPPKEFIYHIHPEYLLKGGNIPVQGLYFGDNLLFSILSKIFANPVGWLPPMNEIYHYPYLCVGWFGMFVTVLNLLPMGQLDGGHIAYAMFGKFQGKIARIVWYAMIIFGVGSLLNIFRELLLEDYSNQFFIFLQNNLLPILQYLKTKIPWFFEGMSGWLFWALIVKFFIKLDHIEIYDSQPIGKTRMFLGYLALIIFVLCFSHNGIYEL